MRPVRDDVRIEGDLVALETIEVTLDVKATPHLINMYTDLYKDRRWAVVREYLANALDATIAAQKKGQPTRPVEVHTPSPLGEPVFKVKDYGVGLDRQDIIEVISKYGASTKRETDDETGCLGLGCKSALTYSPQFTYTGVKNGVKTIIVTQRDAKNGVVMKKVFEGPTDEPNGVEVQVPVKPGDGDYFEQKSKEMLSYWPEGVALLNGKEPEKINRDFPLTDDIFLTKALDERAKYRQYRNHDDGEQMTIVMGNVPYPIHTTLFQQIMHSKKWQFPWDHNVIAYVPMGSVEFEPSREGLRDTKLTKETLVGVINEYEKHVSKQMQAQIDACKTRWEAMKLVFALSKQFPGFPTPTYKGEKFPHSFEYEGEMWSLHKLNYYLSQDGSAPQRQDQYGYRRNQQTGKMSQAWEYSYNGVYVDGFNLKKWNRRHLDKLLGVLKEKGLIDDGWQAAKDKLGQKPLLVFEKMPDEVKKWVDPQWIISYDDMREFKLPKPEGSGDGSRETYAGTYEDHRGPNYVYTVAQLEEKAKNGNLYYAETKRERHLSDYFTVMVDHQNSYNAEPARYYYQAITAVNRDAILICVPGTRLEKFKRIFGDGAKEIREAIKTEYETRVKKAGSRVLARCALMSERGTGLVAELQKGGKIDDPELRKLGVLLNDKQLKRKAEDLRRAIDGFANLGYSVPPHPESIKKFREVYSRYPLFGAINNSTRYTKELVLYANAAYAARSK